MQKPEHIPVPKSRKSAVLHKPELFSDSSTTIESLKELVKAFIAERKWEAYHTPKDVAVSLAVEAGELLELFQWENPAPSMISAEKKEEIACEMADVLAYLLSLSNVLNIDLSEALQRKMVKNRNKYPTQKFCGNWEKVR